MVTYRRNFIAGGSFFFTVNLENRRLRLLTEHIDQLRAADFAMTLGEFYCKGLAAPVMVEIKRDDVVFARVYDIRGRSISSLLSIPAP